MTHNKRNRTVLGLSPAASLIALGACGAGGEDSGSAGASEESTSESSEKASSEGGPDLAGIPDVVAEVNGEEVTKDEFVPVYEAQFQQAATQAQTTGQAPDEDALKEQTADNLVSTELLSQEAEERGLSVTEEDVDNELATLAEENQLGSVDELIAAPEKQGATEEEARLQLEQQMVIDLLIADEAGDAEPTEQELRKIYDRAKQQQAQMGEQGQKLPPYAKVKPQLVEQAKSEQQGKVAQAPVDDLREEADITINL
ncbi:SurA N-terminal domain-containing protein [Nocardioides sp. B-3]|uniref:SurA N-terminal domain-containing protein n=1 Tax=Nocardioides sp. B-3 TaxID=2895565 RepID=UPI002152E5EB|nr:SurA N-terminal domain-containing protein [Nocardioides sp. B-3]UUZ60838.1 SurA N-terminal domain-containing protein [Nocardioides sp. B-3]